MASKLPSEHALRTVIDVMSKHQNDAVVQAKGCEALLDLSSRNECTRMAIFALGGVDAVIAAMAAHSDDDKVQHPANLLLLGHELHVPQQTAARVETRKQITINGDVPHSAPAEEPELQSAPPSEEEVAAALQSLASQTLDREAYRAPDFSVDHVSLTFKIHDDYTQVLSEMTLRREGPPDAPLLLDASEDQELQRIALNGRTLAPEEFSWADANTIAVHAALPPQFSLSTSVRLHPHDNFSGKGLYFSQGRYCTQCEPQCFRMISPMLDRPDVTARYTVRVEADKQQFPLLLSNGNQAAKGDLEGGSRHFVEWQDPHPKPSYLFALFAGDLDTTQEDFVTKSGREVKLRMHTEKGKTDNLRFALRCLSQAMAWEEEAYGLEYDLNEMNVVVLDDFPTGAMENKGLNIYNSACVTIKEDTATDEEKEAVQCTVAHEYLHNWTGNRVTVKNWMELALKEGLTVFRDQQFGECMAGEGAARRRIEDVEKLRGAQLMEETTGQQWMVRPRRVSDVMEVYTPTVYNKGAEIVRMLHDLVGPDAFRTSLRTFLQKFDGQAATVLDFIESVEITSGKDLSQFERWFAQPGTPTVSIEQLPTASGSTLKLRIRQELPSPPTASSSPQPLLIPLRLAVLDRQGNAVRAEEEVELVDMERDVEIDGVPGQAIVSVRGYSAPVHVEWRGAQQEREEAHQGWEDWELGVLMVAETEAFAKWEAAQELFRRAVIARATEEGGTSEAETHLVAGIRDCLADPRIESGLCAKIITPPELGSLGETVWSPTGAAKYGPVDALALSEAVLGLKQHVGALLSAELTSAYMHQHKSDPDDGAQKWTASGVGSRLLKNACLGYLACSQDKDLRSLGIAQAVGDGCMTDVLAATKAVVAGGWEHDKNLVLDHFYQEHAVKDEVLRNKFMTLQDPNNAFFNPYL